MEHVAKMIWEGVQGPVLNLAITAILGVLSVLTARVAIKIEHYFEDRAKAQQSKVVSDTLNNAGRFISEAVLAAEGTVAKAIKEAIKSGTANREHLEAVKPLVIANVKEQLGAGAVGLINATLGDADKWFDTQVEARVEELKIAKNDGMTKAVDQIAAFTQANIKDSVEALGARLFEQARATDGFGKGEGDVTLK